MTAPAASPISRRHQRQPRRPGAGAGSDDRRGSLRMSCRGSGPSRPAGGGLAAGSSSRRRQVFSAWPVDRRAPPPAGRRAICPPASRDWTQTGWPSTMEGAVRSGYLAAVRSLFAAAVRRGRSCQPDLPVERAGPLGARPPSIENRCGTTPPRRRVQGHLVGDAEGSSALAHRRLGPSRDGSGMECQTRPAAPTHARPSPTREDSAASVEFLTRHPTKGRVRFLPRFLAGMLARRASGVAP